MSDFDEKVRNILRTTADNGSDLIKQIEIIAEENKHDHSWMNDKCFKSFVDELEPHVSIDINDWKEDKTFLELVKAVNDQIIIRIKDGEKNMVTDAELAIGTKFIITAGLLSVIAIALYTIRDAKNKKGSGSNETSHSRGRKEKEEHYSNKVSIQSQSSGYGQYILLLIIEANRLDKNLKPGNFSKDQAEKLISNAAFAYCFAENDTDGQKVLEGVDCLDKDEDINYESEGKVFLQLSLYAKSKIAEGKPDKLGIREAMNPSQQVEIKTLKKLKTTRSIKSFYSI